MNTMELISFLIVPIGAAMIGVAAWCLAKSITKEGRKR